MRIGQSTDIHPFAGNRKLVLGGVIIPYEKGLAGHSDADVLVHAVIEAIIGAMGLGDIGSHFPDTDPQYEGISSLVLLRKTRELMEENNCSIGNVDALVLIEEPKLRPYVEEMKKNIADALNCETARINVKATRGEKLGFIGRKEGVMAQAVVLLEEVR